MEAPGSNQCARGHRAVSSWPVRHPEPRQAVRELFRNRNFTLLWVGQLLSQIGDQCLIVAGITLISGLSSSPLAMLVPALFIAAPQIIFGLVGGVIADRVDRKLVMGPRSDPSSLMSCAR